MLKLEYTSFQYMVVYIAVLQVGVLARYIRSGHFPLTFI